MRGDDGTVPDPGQSVIVVGHGGMSDVGDSLGMVPGVRALSAPPAADGNEPESDGPQAAVTMIVTDFSGGTAPPVEWLDDLTVRAGLSIAVVAAPATADGFDPALAREAERLRRAVDAMVVVPPGSHRRGVRAVVTTVAELVGRPGVINLDPADLRTVLSDGPVAAVATGTGTESGDLARDAAAAVRTALEASYLDVGTFGAVLVNLVGGPELTLSAAVDAVDGIQRSIPDEAVLIWGVAVEESLAGVHAQVVASSDAAPRFDRVLQTARVPSASEDCPRCGGHVAAYSLGDSETVACDDCGFSGTNRTL